MQAEIELVLNHQYQPAIVNGQEKNKTIESLVSDELIRRVYQFHQTLPGYQKTPVRSLQNLANHCQLNNLWVKDESLRFDLKAFKVLGASFAIAQLIQQAASDHNLPLEFEQLRNWTKSHPLKLATTTDGNHGRAVAWCANKFGCESFVFMPKGSSKNRLNAIKHYATHAEITEDNYDQTVSKVSQLAKQNSWTLVQDTAWQGYESIPADIKRGYFTLLSEFEFQQPGDWPTHVFLQAGVGSMAAAIAAYFVNHQQPTPKIILVEPDKAPCFFNSMLANDGLAHLYEDDMDTIMAGLACGLPSKTAWEILKDTAFATIKCKDKVSVKGMRRAIEPIGDDASFVSGESAAVTLGLVEQLKTHADFLSIAEKIHLDAQSKVLLFSTEGDTDPDIYQSIIKQEIRHGHS